MVLTGEKTISTEIQTEISLFCEKQRQALGKRDISPRVLQMPQTCTTSLPLQTTLHEKKGGEKVMANKVTKRQLLSSALALTVSGTMLLGTTMAWFTDTATLKNTTITSGNLKLEVSGVPTGGIQIDKLTSADPQTQTITLKNAGSVDAIVEVTKTITQTTEGDVHTKHLQTYGLPTGKYFLGAGEQEEYTLTVALANVECNDCKDKSYTLDIDFNATQIKKVQKVTSADELKTALENAIAGTHIILGDTEINNTVMGKENTVKYNVPSGVVLDGGKFTGNVALNVLGDAVIRNVKFEGIQNGESEFKQKLSAIYAYSLTGSLVVDNCTFNDVEYEALQLTPNSSSNITVTNCEFDASKQVARYIHIQHHYPNDSTDYILEDGNVTISNNTFKNCQYTSDKVYITSLGTILITNIDFSNIYLGKNKFQGTSVDNCIFMTENGNFVQYDAEKFHKALIYDGIVNFQEYYSMN
jgi:hypothetical protein